VSTLELFSRLVTTKFTNKLIFFISTSVSAETRVKNHEFEEKKLFFDRRHNKSGLMFGLFILPQMCNLDFFPIAPIANIKLAK
jgi:hypothetical protein